MSRASIELNNLRIATPCPLTWEEMRGDDHTRFCGDCRLNVYNISGMTSRETAELITRSEGRICARLYRRADGTILTKDCKVGVRALRKRVSKQVAAVFAALASLCFTAVGQTSSGKARTSSCTPQTKITRTSAEGNRDAPALAGTVLDPNGAVIPGARILITNLQTKETNTTSSNEEGRFLLASVVEGDYSVKIEATAFKIHEVKNVFVEKDKLLNIDTTLEVDGDVATVGLLMFDTPLIDRPAGTVIMNGDYIRRLPL